MNQNYYVWAKFRKIQLDYTAYDRHYLLGDQRKLKLYDFRKIEKWAGQGGSEQEKQKLSINHWEEAGVQVRQKFPIDMLLLSSVAVRKDE